MPDADDAQLKATLAVLGSGCSSDAGREKDSGSENSNLLPLMCYYHVVAKVYQRTRSLRSALAAKVLKNVGDMHYSVSSEEFLATKEKVLADWESNDELNVFRSYFVEQWLTGRFTHWQIYHTPRGFATTNNPVEQFNRTLKRVYTLHARLKMGNLLMQLSTCCRVEGMSMKSFNVTVVPTSSLQRRMRELRRERKLYVPLPPRNSMAYLLQDDFEAGAGDFVRVISTRCERVHDPATGRKSEAILTTAQMSSCGARMETEGMPVSGWTVSVPDRTCECRYFAKFGTCVHLLLILSNRGITASGKREVLYYRGPNKARRLAINGQHAGRPGRNSSALVIE